MKCYYCEKEPHAVCRFCGAMVCRDHTRGNRYVGGHSSTGQSGWGALPRREYDYVVVDNAIWCGRCAIHTFRSQ